MAAAPRFPPPKIILFDLGNVLLPFDRERRVRVMSEWLAIEPQAVRDFMAGDIHQRLDLGEADEVELAAAFSALVGREVSPERACALVLSVFGPPNADLWALARRLRATTRVGGFSDNPVFVREVFPESQTLDPMFWSAELGLTKADPRAHAVVQERLGLAAETILFIDDTPANVALARGQGWDALVYTADAALLADLAARGLA